jgi:hypothetical protein
MKIFLLVLFGCLISSTTFAQDRKLKENQTSLAQLMLFEIKLNPNDTMFNSVDFSYLPLKGFPYFLADPNQSFYTVAQRDSIIRKVDGMFFEEEIE